MKPLGEYPQLLMLDCWTKSMLPNLISRGTPGCLALAVKLLRQTWLLCNGPIDITPSPTVGFYLMYIVSGYEALAWFSMVDCDGRIGVRPGGGHESPFDRHSPLCLSFFLAVWAALILFNHQSRRLSKWDNQ